MISKELFTLFFVAAIVGYAAHKHRRYLFGMGLTEQEQNMRAEYNDMRDRIDATLRFNQIYQLEQDIAAFAKKYDGITDKMLHQKYWVNLIQRATHRKRMLLPNTFGGFQ